MSSKDSFAERCNAYAREVGKLRGSKITAGRWLRLAARRHIRDLKKYRKSGQFEFVPWYADDVCQFAERMPHVEGTWNSDTITLEDPQVFILACVFGWRRRDKPHIRRFSQVYIEMARKGAKSTLTAIIALYCVACENERGAQVIIGATTKEQAGKVFDPARAMVDAKPAFREAFGAKSWANSITVASTGGYIKTLSSVGKRQDGWNPHVGILDELHAHDKRDLFDVIASAFGARDNPLLWLITTAGYNSVGICYEQHLYLEKVLEGALIADHLFGVIYTIDKKDDPFDESIWVKANPMLGITPKLENMRRSAINAQASPAALAEFETKHLNIWRNAASRWLSMDKWAQCANADLSWDDFKGLDCYIGGDLADKDDITALAMAAEREDGTVIVKTMFWLPEQALMRPEHAEGRGAAPYAQWVKDGYLMLTPGDWVDHNEIEDVIREWVETLNVKRVTFDQFAAAQAMASRLNEDLGDGEEPLAAILHKKASNVTDPAKELEARVKSGPSRILHDNNPVMNWMASNVVVARRRDETLLPIKESQDSPNKIDGIDAAINAIHPMTLVPEEDFSDQPFVDL